MADAVREAIAAGSPRIAVSGGDGTIAAVASVVLGTPVELAVIPGGTLNHFARDYEIPHDPGRAVALALAGRARPVDIGTVNGRVFINTSSVGAYVTFVRTRERIERWAGYRLASLVAALRIWPRLRSFRTSVNTPQEAIVTQASLVFVGVGERSLELPNVGARTHGGVRALHVVLVHGRGSVRRWARAFDRATYGDTGAGRAPPRVAASSAADRPRAAVPGRHQFQTALVDASLVDACRVDLPRPRGNVSLDGEIVSLEAPLAYEIRRDALRVVMP